MPAPSQLINIHTLSQRLCRSVQTIRNDICRNPAAVPPRVVIPGTRLCRWREEDVDVWVKKNSLAPQASPLPHENLPHITVSKGPGRPRKTLTG